MKAIILERRGDEAVVLCEDGTFARRRVSGEVGETVELSADVVAFPTKKKSKWLQSAVAAALALTVTGSTFGYTTASAYVSLDVEDSAIELKVNHFGRVIAVDAVSEGAEELAERLFAEVRHQKVERALDRAMIRLNDEGYLHDENDAVIVGVASDSSRRKADLTQFAESAAAGHVLYMTESSRAEREQAMEQHMSVGRFGFERDHLGPPGAKTEDNKSRVGTIEQTVPAIPASGTVGGESGKTKPERPEREEHQDGPQQDETPRENEQSGSERPEPPQAAANQSPEQAPQGEDQPVSEKEQMARDGNEPDRSEGRLPQDGAASSDTLPRETNQQHEPLGQPEYDIGAPHDAQGRRAEPRMSFDAPRD